MADNRKSQNFFGSIKGKIISCAVVCIVIIIAATAVINSLVLRKALITSQENLLIEQAELNSQIIDDWLVKQGDIVVALKNALVTMDRTNENAIMDFLNSNLKENEDALMYYCCFGYNGGVFPANHAKLDLDPSTRSWWKDAVSKGSLIYTAPYTDFATGQMIVSMAVPFKMAGEQACVLADITIDSIIAMVKGVSTDENVQTFLLADDGSVIIHSNEDYLPKESGNTILADSYKNDASFYADVSSDFGDKTARLNDAISEINKIMEGINISQSEMDDAVRSVNENLQQITNASENVAHETTDVIGSIETLKTTVGRFNI